MVPRHLDDIDERLLAELTKNARVPLVTLGERVHLSRNAVRQRVERMERDGVIGGYTVTRGKNHGVGQPLRANVFVYRADRMRGDLALTAIGAIPEVVRCDILSGDFDLLVAVETESAERMQAVWEQIAALPDVTDTVTSLTLATTVNRGA